MQRVVEKVHRLDNSELTGCLEFVGLELPILSSEFSVCSLLYFLLCLTSGEDLTVPSCFCGFRCPCFPLRPPSFCHLTQPFAQTQPCSDLALGLPLSFVDFVGGKEFYLRRCVCGVASHVRYLFWSFYSPCWCLLVRPPVPDFVGLILHSGTLLGV